MHKSEYNHSEDMFLCKMNNINSITWCITCSKLIKTSELSYWHEDIKKHWCHSGVFIVKLEQIPHLLGIWKSVVAWVYQQRSNGREVKVMKHARTGPNYAILPNGSNKTWKQTCIEFKGMLRPIFCFDINTHSDRKLKNYVKFT